MTCVSEYTAYRAPVKPRGTTFYKMAFRPPPDDPYSSVEVCACRTPPARIRMCACAREHRTSRPDTPSPSLHPRPLFACASQTVAQVGCLKDSQVVLFTSGLIAHATSGSARTNPDFFAPSKWIPPLTYFRVIACGHSHVLAIATHACGVRVCVRCPRHASAPTHANALRLAWAQGGVYAWGANNKGQLGIGEAGEARAEPVLVTHAPQEPVAIAAGTGHSAVVNAQGAVFTFGWNNSGQLGARCAGRVCEGRAARAGATPRPCA